MTIMLNVYSTALCSFPEYTVLTNVVLSRRSYDYSV